MIFMNGRTLQLKGMILAMLLPSVCAAQQWTRFRGPNGAGLADAARIPISFTEKDYLWNVQLPGTGHSSPVIWGDRVFVTCCSRETAARTIVCLNAADGAVKWKKEFASQTYRQHVDNSYAASSPAVDGSNVYVIWTTPDEYTLLAMNHAGNEIWRTSLGRYTSQHGSGTSPIVFQDMVIVTNDQEGPGSSVVAVDCTTGQVRWKTTRKTGSMAASTPCIYQGAGEGPQLILTSRMEGVTGLDPRNGQLLWQVADVFGFRVIASPVVAGGLVIGNCGEGPNGKGLVAVRPPAAGKKAEVAWRMVNQSPYVPTPLCKGELLFTLSDTGTVSCLRAATGQVVWQERIGGAYYSSPVCLGDRLYCVSKKGALVVVSATEKYQLLGRSQLPELCYATPAVSEGRMYIRTLSRLICIGR